MALSLREKGPRSSLILLAVLVGYMAYTGTLLDTLGMSGHQGQQGGGGRGDPGHGVTLEAADRQRQARPGAGTVEDLRHSWRATGRACAAAAAGAGAERSAEPARRHQHPGKIRGVNLAEVSPCRRSGARALHTYKYKIRVMGHYDQIGEFLGDIAASSASSSRSISLAPANPAKALGDTTGAMLEAKFQIRTYVKSASAAEGEASGT